jgi:Immunoglobulin domain
MFPSFSFIFSSSLAGMKTRAVSKAKILGNPELFIKSGNDINLTCTTSQISSPPSFIYWYKGGRVVNYSQRGGINVSTDRMTKTSNLIISRATPADSGNYTCAPSNSGKLIN